VSNSPTAQQIQDVQDTEDHHRLFPGVASPNITPNTGGLAPHDPGPLAADAWFPQITGAETLRGGPPAIAG